MSVHFLTSAFDDGLSREFVEQLSSHCTHGGKFVFVASDFSGHERTEKYCRQFFQLFKEKGVSFSSYSIVDFQLSPEQARQEIASAEIVWLSGGDTLKQMAYLREYGLPSALRERDGVTIGMSAGSINMARRVVLAKDENDNIPELSVYEGIGLVDCNVEPHVNQASQEHWQEIMDASQIAPIHCLWDNAFLVERDGDLQIFGRCAVARCGKLHPCGAEGSNDNDFL